MPKGKLFEKIYDVAEDPQFVVCNLSSAFFKQCTDLCVRTHVPCTIVSLATWTMDRLKAVSAS